MTKIEELRLAIKDLEEVLNDKDADQKNKELIEPALHEYKRLLKQYETSAKQVHNAKEAEKAATTPVKRKLAKVHKERTEKKHKTVEGKVKKRLGELQKFVSENKGFEGYHGKTETELESDANRKAMNPGKRISAEGNVYYENRANRSDVQPNKVPRLGYGGKLKTYVKEHEGFGAYKGKSAKELEDDALNKAKKPGKRVSASGKVYYESRANRSDVQPTKFPRLEKGGSLENTKFAIAVYFGDQTEYVGPMKETSGLLDNAVRYATREEAEQALAQVKEYGDAMGWAAEYGIYEFDASPMPNSDRVKAEANGENINVFGYQTRFFDNCANAVEAFENAIDEIEREYPKSDDHAINISIRENLSRAAQKLDDILELEQERRITATEFTDALDDFASFAIHNYRSGLRIQNKDCLNGHITEIALKHDKVKSAIFDQKVKGIVYIVEGVKISLSELAETNYHENYNGEGQYLEDKDMVALMKLKVGEKYSVGYGEPDYKRVS